MVNEGSPAAAATRIPLIDLIAIRLIKDAFQIFDVSALVIFVDQYIFDQATLEHLTGRCFREGRPEPKMSNWVNCQWSSRPPCAHAELRRVSRAWASLNRFNFVLSDISIASRSE